MYMLLKHYAGDHDKDHPNTEGGRRGKEKKFFSKSGR